MQGSSWLRDPRYDAGLDELARLDAAEAAAYAARCRVLAGLAARTSREGWQAEAPWESLVLDVAGTCRLGQVAAGSRLVDAEHLVVRLPEVLEALESGALRVPQAQVVVEQTRALTPAACAQVVRRVLPHAGALCPADLRRLLKRTVLEVDAEAVARQEVAARRSRRTWVRPAEDGMAVLCALLPAEQAQAALAGLTEQARRARADGDERSVDQLRADLLVERCTVAEGCHGAGPAPDRRRRRSVRPVRVVVHVPLAVAQGLSDAPAHLEGHGPLSAAHARRLLVDAELQRACAEPETGIVWSLEAVERTPGPATQGRCPTGSALHEQLRRRRHLDEALRELAERPPPVPLAPEPQHDPSAALARLVRTRDGRCDGPGCSVPASRCELDHEQPWPDGDTSAGNLVARSQRCHHAKHAGWTVDRTSDGTAWTSPGGRRYVVPHRRSLSPGGPGASRRARRAAALRERGVLLLSYAELAPDRGDGGLGGPDVASEPGADATRRGSLPGARTAAGEEVPAPF